jgi:hypothetical protein
MRKDYQKFICDFCGRTLVADRYDVEYNVNKLEVFDVTDTNDETKEYCSEECMLKGLQDIMTKDKTLGRRIDLRLESYKYEYEYEEE